MAVLYSTDVYKYNVGIFQLTMLNEAPSHFNLELSALGQKIRVDYMLIVKVSHLCTTNFMNNIPIFLQLLKELPR